MSIPMAVQPRGERPPLGSLLLAALTLVIATVLVHLAPMRLTLAVARLAKRCTRRAATPAEALRFVAARDWASGFFPSRVACLEKSLAGLLAASLSGLCVDWCIGCRFDPCESHSWIESASQPVGEPDTPDRPFHVTIRI